jgi:predicted nucleic acid-binding protein
MQAVVVADTGPLNYLVQIEAADLLPKLFGRIVAPVAVRDELSHPRSPEAVRAWIAHAPHWLDIRPNPDLSNFIATPSLDEGERAAIELADAIDAALILMDDREGVAFARAKGLAVTGTLGVLDLAAQHGLIDLGSAFTRLQATSFHYRQGLLDALLSRQSEEKK